MPFIDTKVSAKITEEDKKILTARLGKAIELLPGKTERWLMLAFTGEVDMAFAGTLGDCAMVNVKIFDKSTDKAYSALTAEICRIMSEVLAISPDRVYVQYDECSFWGYNGSNF